MRALIRWSRLVLRGFVTGSECARVWYSAACGYDVTQLFIDEIFYSFFFNLFINKNIALFIFLVDNFY